MRVLLQKVSSASVSVGSEKVGSIGPGYLLFVGVLHGDTEAEAEWLAQKIVNLRLFAGEDGKINDRSVLDMHGEVLVVSQFTLAGSTEKGNRPDYTSAAPPALAEVLYSAFIDHLKSLGVRHVASGRFGAAMQVTLVNDGPVTLLIDRSSPLD